MRIFSFTDGAHSYWNRNLKPIAKIEPEEIITVKTRDSSDGQINKDSDVKKLEKMDFSKVNPSTGPFYIENAEPGDTIAVNIMEIKNSGWGWTGIIPGFGLFAGDSSLQLELSGPALKIWISDEKYSRARFGDVEIEIKNDPFIGTIGDSLGVGGRFSIVPPRENGGNMDNKIIGEGSRLYLPVFVKGALLSLGDVHLSQGDGEVCGTAIEAPAEVKLSVSLIKRSIKMPYVEFRGRQSIYNEYVSFSGFSNNLIEATKIAVLRMINAFSDFMEPSEAYMLASVAMDLRISELVDMPNYHVSGVLPFDIIKNEEVREKIKKSIK